MSDPTYKFKQIFGQKNKYTDAEIEICSIQYPQNLYKILSNNDILNPFIIKSIIRVYKQNYAGQTPLIWKDFIIEKIKDKKIIDVQELYETLMAEFLNNNTYNNYYYGELNCIKDIDEIAELLLINYQEIKLSEKHLNILFLKNMRKSILYSLNYKNIVSSFVYFKLLVCNNNIASTKNEIFDEYFGGLAYNIEWLKIACEYTNTEIIFNIMNQKINPNNDCFNLLLKNANINNTEKISLIDIFIKYGYQITETDLLSAIEKHITLNNCEFTLNYNPTAAFFNKCKNATFYPIYNENIEKNNNYIEYLCNRAYYGHDFNTIKSLITKYNICLSDNCIKILNSKLRSGTSKQLLIVANDKIKARKDKLEKDKLDKKDKKDNEDIEDIEEQEVKKVSKKGSKKTSKKVIKDNPYA